MKSLKKYRLLTILLCSISILTACTGSNKAGKRAPDGSYYSASRSDLADPIIAISRLNEQQYEWKGTPYRIGGRTKSGVDCSGFVQVTFKDLFGISLPRSTTEQAKVGRKISKRELRTGDLVFFKTGEGPNGNHVGVYVKSGQFLHASTKAGVIYSDMNSPYWSKTFWQARRL